MSRSFSTPFKAVLLSWAVAGLPSAALGQATVYRIPVTGGVELGMAPYVERSLDEAAAAGAAFVVIDLDTPGGQVSAAERIADAIADSSVPVYALVDRRALGAGALVALSTRGIYMRPGSVIGAAARAEEESEETSGKIVSAMRSEMSALAVKRGLDSRVAEAMVDQDVAIPGVVEAGKLLTLTTEDAVGLRYATEVDDFTGLLASLSAPDARVVTAEANWAEHAVRFFSSPIVAPFLLALGFLGLLVEIKMPHFGMAGVAGLLALSLFFGSHLIVGLAGVGDVIVFGVGLIFLGIEVFLIPGFGVFGVLGVLGVLGGLYLSLMGAFPTTADFARAGLILTTTVLLIAVTAWAMIRTLPHSARLARSGIFLLRRADRAEGYTTAPSRKDLVGVIGKAITDLRPSGTGLFGDERIDVVSEAAWITEGTPIRIISAEGYRHVVRAVGPELSEHG
jgi:membrane-bound serine protease (ClpP class)